MLQFPSVVGVAAPHQTSPTFNRLEDWAIRCQDLADTRDHCVPMQLSRSYEDMGKAVTILQEKRPDLSRIVTGQNLQTWVFSLWCSFKMTPNKVPSKTEIASDSTAKSRAQGWALRNPIPGQVGHEDSLAEGLK